MLKIGRAREKFLREMDKIQDLTLQIGVLEYQVKYTDGPRHTLIAKVEELRKRANEAKELVEAYNKTPDELRAEEILDVIRSDDGFLSKVRKVGKIPGNVMLHLLNLKGHDLDRFRSYLMAVTSCLFEDDPVSVEVRKILGTERHEDCLRDVNFDSYLSKGPAIIEYKDGNGIWRRSLLHDMEPLRSMTLACTVADCRHAITKYYTKYCKYNGYLRIRVESTGELFPAFEQVIR